MPIIRRKLQASDVYPDDIRYNESTDQVEMLIDGVWTPAPGSDPRRQTTLPPRITADTRCDAAQSVADALEGQISQILTAIDNAGTVYTIAGLILGLLAFGPFGIFIGIALFLADQMLSAGTATIEAALPPSAYETLTCILWCYMDTNGRLDEGGLATVQSEVTAQIGGIGAVILNQMLALAGEGGINNLAAAGTSTGDCDECDCAGWCYEWIALGESPDWVMSGSQPFGNYGYLYTEGWGTSQIGGVIGTRPDGYSAMIIDTTLPSRTITQVEIWVTGGAATLRRVGFPNVYSGFVNMTFASGRWVVTGSWNVTQIRIFFECFTLNNPCKLTKIRLTGLGNNPFGADNCV